jgi:hypothetical protein
MGPFSTAVAIGCLTALRWLFWLTAALMALLIIKQAMSGDGIVGGLVIATAGFAGLGWLSGFGANLIQEAQDK